MKYAFVRAHRDAYSVAVLCDTLGVSASGYYDWFDRPESERQRTTHRLLTKIRCFHQSSRETYGSPRLHKDLTGAGECVSRSRVARLMRSVGIQSKMANKFVITTNSKNTRAPAPDRLQRAFRVAHKNT